MILKKMMERRNTDTKYVNEPLIENLKANYYELRRRLIWDSIIVT